MDLDVGACIFSPLLFPAALVLQTGFLRYDVGDIRGNASLPVVPLKEGLDWLGLHPGKAHSSQVPRFPSEPPDWRRGLLALEAVDLAICGELG